MIIDESHVTVPQLGGMYGGDASRKRTLIEHGFRLPSAADNRPLKFPEFEERLDQVVYVSATPADYEIKQSSQVVEQIIRPTGLMDPEVVVRPVTGQVEDLMKRIRERAKKKELTLVTTLTKKMAEDLADYLNRPSPQSSPFEGEEETRKPSPHRGRGKGEGQIKAKYLHSDIDTLERLQILADFRRGQFAVLVGVNLLREGLDLPEVSLVAILDADKEGFLRNATSLIQTTGRAARNVHGQVIFYADRLTGSLAKAISETNRRRAIQLEYNKQHGITPRTIKKKISNILEDFGLHPRPKGEGRVRGGKDTRQLDLELDIKSSGQPLEQIIKEKETQMRAAAKQLEFELAALLRDEIKELKRRL
jgi:excinuclease ABC subunit B